MKWRVLALIGLGIAAAAAALQMVVVRRGNKKRRDDSASVHISGMTPREKERTEVLPPNSGGWIA